MGSISVDNMYENLCNILKAQGRVEKISKSFSEMANDNDRVKIVYNLLADMKLLPSFQKLKIRSKNASESTRLRNEGNKLFQKKNDNEALKLYTQSIMCAPVTDLNECNCGDNVSLGFANRSAVLFVKEKFKDCLKDIERAIEYEYPTKLRYKLLERKAKCCYNLGRLNEAKTYSVEALECLSLAEGLSEEKRLQIEKELREFQKLPIKVDLPESSSPDLAHELPEKTYDQHSQIPCATSAMKICYSPDMGRYIEAAENLRPGDVLLVEKPYASVLLPEFYSSHCSLCLRHSWSPVPCLHCTMGGDNGTASAAIGGVLLRHLQNLPCNAHEVTEYVRTLSTEGHHVAESIEIGAAAYATLSLLNHGCDPGVVRHSVAGDCVVLRALRPVQCGEQLLDNYGQHYALHPRSLRQAHLQSQYHFSCSCEPCVQDWPCYSDLPSTSPRYLCVKCRSRLLCEENTTSIVCSSCGEKTDLLALQQKLLSSSKNFLQLLTKLLEGNELTDETPLVEHLQLLDSRVERPWKEYSDCQETLKQCFNLQGNYYYR